DMIASTIGSLVPRQQRALCTRLSGETQVPLPVVQQLLHAQVDGFDAFVASTKHLSDEAGLEIIRMSGAGRYARALARRLNVSIDVQRALRDLGDAAIDRALELRQMGPVEVAVIEPVQPKPLLPYRVPRPSVSDEIQEAIVALCAEPDAALLATLLSDTLGTDFTKTKLALEAKETDSIIAMLRFASFDADMALRAFKRMVWRRYPDKAACEAFTAKLIEMADTDVDKGVRALSADA
ncbi:MAG: hypothetical protein AAFP99_06545, partial [Pseudomonadota bacterium]